MFRIIYFLPVILFILSGCTRNRADDTARFVDPTIGSGAHGHVFVGANVPMGAVQLGPTNISQGWDWTSGYHSSDNSVIGFAHTHLSGTGIGDKGDIHFMPMTGIGGISEREYMSTYDPKREIAEAGYYSTYLEKYGITAELTATQRTGFHRYTFPATDSACILVNFERGIGWDQLTASGLKGGDNNTNGYRYGKHDNIPEWTDLPNDRALQGYRLSEGWAKDDRIYFYAEFSKPIQNIEVIDKRPGYVTICFGETKEGDIIEARVGISGVDIEGAKANFDAEAKGVSFDHARREARKAWNNLLSSIEVETSDTARLRTFYTALYHSAFFPSVFNDVSGRYRGADGNIHENPGHDIYTILSLWDTYRAAHPLYTLTQPDRVSDFINTFIRIYEEQGKVPVWHLAGNETDCMIGFPSVMVIADAILKDIPGFDVGKAYEAIKAYELLDERGLKQIREIGYIPADQEGESVAKALEYCIADWSVAQVAKKLGKTDDYNHFIKRSKGYVNYFDPEDHFFKGRLSDGSWLTPFDPERSLHRGDVFCEGNGWQYLWLVPHDFEGLFALFPNEDSIANKLDQTFTIPYEAGEGSSPDISGMIGQYAQGNEPNHSTIYAYAYLGQQWKTAELARRIMDELYSDTREGLCGNEDAGQMSAWYVFNALGFYPANPVNGAFVLGSPVFDKATINLHDNKTFTIITENNSPDNIYIQSVTLNGQAYTKAYITYSDIMAGGEMRIVMGKEPNKLFGTDMADRPKSEMI